MEPALIPLALLLEANQDPGLRGRVHPQRVDIPRVPLVVADQIVGFYTPHYAANGRMRLGPIYVTPAHRGKGLVAAVYRSITVPMMASILDWNESSRVLHERVGFERWRRFARGWYYRRD